MSEPVLHYRVRADSRYRRGLEQETYLRAMRRILERQREVIEAGGLEVLAKKEEFLLELRAHQAYLVHERDRLPPPKPPKWTRLLERLLRERSFLLRGRVAAISDAPRALDAFPQFSRDPLEGSYDGILLLATAPLDEAALSRAREALRPGGTLLVAALVPADEQRLRRAMAERFAPDAFEVEPFEGLILATGRAPGGARLPRLHFMPLTGPGPGPRGGVILAWHRIAELHPDTHQLCVAPGRFREQLKLLRERCTVMPLLDLLHAARAGALPPDAVALTFDDGYLDALTTAAPLLEGLPATFFVNTERLTEPHEAWHDELERLFPDRAAQMEAHARVMPLGHLERRTLLDEMWAASGLDRAPREERRLLLSDQLVRLSRIPRCELGSHSQNHPQLPAHPPPVQRDEVPRGNDELGARLDRPVLDASYFFCH